MKKTILLLALLLSFLSCKKEPNPYEINKQNIGLLTDSTQVKDLKTVFEKDSVVFTHPNKFNPSFTVTVFDTSGKKLLELTPLHFKDSTSVIESIQIIDSKFKTKKGVNTRSTFQDIDENYTISRIDNLINSVVISVNELNASFTIDKKELPSNTRFDRDLQIDATMIPDQAKIKYFMLHWN
ncbi:MAG TPA: hypothetical protein VFF15_09050 [Flavobacteriaceae bacterium]|nr:hypothetical protein [Flavobacteriaceae bacterium]